MTKRIVRVGQVFASGCVVYVVMAACSAGGGPSEAPPGTSGASGTNATSSSGTTASSGSSNGGSSASSGSTGSTSGPVPPAMADDWYKPGTRLKLRYFEGTEGTKQFQGWFDSTRGDECAFTLHADGSIRCLPLVTTYFAGYFADSACNTPVAFRSKVAGAPAAPAQKYAGYSEPGSNGQRRYPVTALYVGNLWSGQLGACINGPSASTAFTTLDFYSIGAEIPSTAFVDATVKTAP